MEACAELRLSAHRKILRHAQDDSWVVGLTAANASTAEAAVACWILG
jgi:hypothetical protein